MILLLFIGILPIAAATVCPEQCECTGTTVNCANRGLVRIPAGIPEDTARLFVLFLDILCMYSFFSDLQENKIGVVRRDDLAALRQLKIL